MIIFELKQFKISRKFLYVKSNVDYSWKVCGLLRIFELCTALWGEAILIKATFEMHLRCMSSSWSSLHQSSGKRPNRPSSAFNVKVLFGLVHSRRHTLVFIYKWCEILSKESFLFWLKLRFPKSQPKITEISALEVLEGRAEISVIFGWDFGRNYDLITSFWI